MVETSPSEDKSHDRTKHVSKPDLSNIMEFETFSD